MKNKAYLKLLSQPQKGTKKPSQDESLGQSYVVTQIKKHPNYGKTFFVASFPNEGARSKANGGRLKAQGMLAGMPDLVIYAQNGNVFHIEYKINGAYLNKNQKHVHAMMESMGHKIVVIKFENKLDCYNQTWDQLQQWGII